MMNKPWFDPDTGTLMLGEYVLEMDSYPRIVEDEAIADAELDAQTQRAASPKDGFAPAAARRGALAGGQSHRHRGLVRVGGAQGFASQAPASHFHATAVKEALGAAPSRRLPEIPAKTPTLKGGA